MPPRLIIEGGAPLRGEVRGERGQERRAARPVPRRCSPREPVVLDNVPELADVRTMRALLERTGRAVADAPDGSTRVQCAR